MSTTIKIISLVPALLLSGSVAAHVWCEPDTLNTYGPTSPVITNVTFSTIDRSSAETEKELYVHTLLTADVSVGETYPFSMTYTLDLAFCPLYSIRVWIDWNQDESFDEPGDLVVTRDGDTGGSVVEDIQVPLTATAGLTRMRVAMKMDPVCGHDPIAACPEPEAFGWHGEIEDYNLIVIAPVESDCTNGIDDDGDGAIDCDDADCAGDPACAAEDCANGIDDDGDGLADCEDSDCVSDPLADCDGDGEPNGTDCAVADPGAFNVPPEIALLFVDRPDPPVGTDAVLSWTGLDDAAGLDTVHDVFTGRLSDFAGVDPWSLATCLAMDEYEISVTDARLTGVPSGGYWYLVRGENSCGLGPLGSGSLGSDRSVGDATCQ